MKIRLTCLTLLLVLASPTKGDPVRRIVRKRPLVNNKSPSFSDLVFGSKIQLLKKPEVIKKTYKPTAVSFNKNEALNLGRPDSPYGLIHQLFPIEGNDVAVTNLEEIPADLDPKEVWLSDGNLLVLKGGFTSPTPKRRVVLSENRPQFYPSVQQGLSGFKPSKWIYNDKKKARIRFVPRKRRRRIAMRRRKSISSKEIY